VETRGRAAHGSRPDLGVDAIARMGHVLVGLEELQARLERTRHPLVGPGSIHASLIEGGQELSSYPERCLLKLERRILPGETADAVRAEVEALSGDASVELGLVRDPFEIDQDAPLVRTLRGQIETAMGAPPEIMGHAAWMDSAITSAAGIPTVVFGPGGEGAHATEEWVSLEDVDKCAGILLATAKELCT
jgi:acetylornithine deacetylase